MRALGDPALEPLVFAITKGVETLEAALAAPKIAPELNAVIYEAETVSHACTKLAAALKRTAPTDIKEERRPPPPPVDAAFLSLLIGFCAALGGDDCPGCGGIIPA